MSKLDTLLSISTQALTLTPPKKNKQWHEKYIHYDELSLLLSKRNGFYAFECALHVYPYQSSGLEIGLLRWNEDSLWKNSYMGLANNYLFFAEDVFGCQFCLKAGESGVYLFDPETGMADFFSKNINDWAELILADYDSITGFPLAHQWQSIFGKLPTNSRLTPKIPFVLGGEFSIENLTITDSVQGMIFRSEIAIKTIGMPDGSEISLTLK